MVWGTAQVGAEVEAGAAWEDADSASVVGAMGSHAVNLRLGGAVATDAAILVVGCEGEGEGEGGDGCDVIRG